MGRSRQCLEFEALGPDDIAAACPQKLYEQGGEVAVADEVALDDIVDAVAIEQAARDALDGPGTAYERLERFLLRERDVLRGCRIGRLTQDPDVFAEDPLRQPVADALIWVRAAIAAVIEQGQARGELVPGIAPDDLAGTILATLQGAYVLARAELDEKRFAAAVRGLLGLLRALVVPP